MAIHKIQIVSIIPETGQGRDRRHRHRRRAAQTGSRIRHPLDETALRCHPLPQPGRRRRIQESCFLCQQAAIQPGQERVGPQHVPVNGIDGRCMNFDQNPVVLRGGCFQ